jgi:hypothetical protein
MINVNNTTGLLIFIVPVLTFFLLPLLCNLFASLLQVFETMSKEINHEL